MPKVMNGASKPEPNADYQLTAKLLNEFRNLWVEQFKEAGIDAVLFSRLSVVALTQLSAIIGVDCGMTVEQFTLVCRTQFNEAHSRAPKFG